MVDRPMVVHRADLEVLLDLPYGEGDDHAEGIAVFREPDAAEPRLLVVYDSPAPERQTPEGDVYADIVPLVLPPDGPAD